jgi:hypothetical protein
MTFSFFSLVGMDLIAKIHPDRDPDFSDPDFSDPDFSNSHTLLTQ